MDNDTFSDISTFRGYHWKGTDCDELNSNIYPGRKEGKNKVIDHDCNGIYGKSNSTGKAFESVLCENTNRLGVAVVGDSAGAHFSIPEKYFNATDIQKGTYHDILRRIADELDLPFESGYTAHVPTADYVSHSVYKYLRNWNLCNNNDYQNVGVNGGDSGNSWGNIKALKRDPVNDHPLLIFFELIGNDVCSKSFDGMTTVAEFEKNVLRLLNWLDSTVPKGSHVWIYGLADGELLYDNLHNWTHPLNVTYAQVYDFLNCLEISPCWGWLNTNATIRRFTTERAMNLSKVYNKILKEHTFENFDMVYYEFPALDILQRRFDEGGIPQDMIGCDGFHPNGLFHSYLADWTWNKLQTEHPDWIGMQNPHNDEIIARFRLKPDL